MKGIRTELPQIEKGIPCPTRQHPARYKKKASLWHNFLQNLKHGDSFIVLQREVQNLTHIARQLQVVIVVRHGPNEGLKIAEGEARVWLAAELPPGTELPMKQKRNVSLVGKPAPTPTPLSTPPSATSDSDLSLI